MIEYQKPDLTPPVRATKLTDQVAATLESRITDGTFVAGQRLPSERELCLLLNVSRTVIREAVRTLSVKGLLEVQTGGGTYVRRPDASLVANAMQLVLSGSSSKVTFEHLFDVRMLLEVEIAGLAAEQASAADLELLRVNLGQMRALETEPAQWAMADVEFHQLVAQATQNPLYPVLLGSIGDRLTEVRLTGIELSGTAERAFLHHQAILQAIVAKNKSAARKAMQAHLRESRETFTLARLRR